MDSTISKLETPAISFSEGDLVDLKAKFDGLEKLLLGELSSLKDDVTRNNKEEKREKRQAAPEEVQLWLRNVEGVERKAADLLKEIEKLFQEVNNLKCQGRAFKKLYEQRIVQPSLYSTEPAASPPDDFREITSRKRARKSKLIDDSISSELRNMSNINTADSTVPPDAFGIPIDGNGVVRWTK